MNISNAHNLHHAIPADRPYGIRVGLKAGDPFIKLVGADWQKLHWFGSERERDAALADMSSRYPTFRIGDEPSLTFERIEKPADEPSGVRSTPGSRSGTVVART